MSEGEKKKEAWLKLGKFGLFFKESFFLHSKSTTLDNVISSHLQLGDPNPQIITGQNPFSEVAARAFAYVPASTGLIERSECFTSVSNAAVGEQPLGALKGPLYSHRMLT